MSGIVAAHGPFDPRLGHRMLDRLVHRGPDGEGTRSVGDSWLGHRRLGITDVEGADQPLATAGGDLWLVGDGSFYNRARIRTELGEGRSVTLSHHEAALRVYEKRGVDGFDDLWGTFALAIAGVDGRFVATRDTIGVAPLYWARRDDTVVLASELKAFDGDWRADVEPFPAGHAWTPAHGLRPWRPFAVGTPVLLRSLAADAEPPAWVFDAVRDTLVRAVEAALAPNVPAGVLLSGGLDSSVVTAIAARAAKRDGWTLPTFAAGLPDSPDLVAARAVAEHAGTHHHERVYSAEEAIELVPEVIWRLESFDPTLVHSAVPNHLVAELAGRHVKLVLIGEGADELFAGYSHYARLDAPDELHEELVETIRGLHIGGLQRVDRMTSANAVEPRIPFLDLDMVALSLALPPAWKVARRDRPAKWLLRRAFEGWLPDAVLWREKAQFGQGTGMGDVLREHFDSSVSAEEFERERAVIEPPLRTPEELAYYRIFSERLGGVRAEQTIGRFVEA